MTSTPPIRERLHALDAQAWLFVIAAVASTAVAAGLAWTAAAASASTIILFAAFAAMCYLVVREIARPDVRGECKECGRAVVVDPARDSNDAAVTVQFAAEPERRTVGPVEMIADRNRQRHTFCTAVCARANLGSLEDLDGEPEPSDPEPTERPQQVRD
ncbi:hypothetical protein [Natronomonas marina]|uniref:hypothetical protein n=1 Tax=Natronomonas marina TaxID=2961939 RepID=UPI0020C950A7|nr:hypothetical protein [Natronomonas marina]